MTRFFRSERKSAVTGSGHFQYVFSFLWAAIVFVHSDPGFSQYFFDNGFSLTHSEAFSFYTVDASDTAYVRIVAAGDLMLAGSALPIFREKGLTYPFDSVRSVLADADIGIVNLEAPLTDQGEPFPKQYNFRMPPGFVSALQSEGLNLCTLANNHILDFGMAGLNQTLTVLDSAGIAHCGAGRSLDEAEQACLIVKHGLRVGVLAYSLTYPAEFWANSRQGGTVYPTPDRMRRCITALRSRVDFLIVSFHWGQERMETPKSYQRSQAHQAVQLGADLVIGHHPHVIQGIEMYRGAPIFYSLGNFVFGSFNYSCKTSILAQVDVDSTGLKKVMVIPINVFNPQVKLQPRVIRGEKKRELIAYINGISRDLNQTREILDAEGSLVLKQTGPFQTSPKTIISDH